MTRGLGDLGIHIKHIITYSLSPFEQRAFAGLITRGVPNLIRRFSEEVLYILPGLSTAALIYHYGTKNFNRRQRKNPADYENEK